MVDSGITVAIKLKSAHFLCGFSTTYYLPFTIY